VLLEGLGKLKKVNDLNGNRTRNLPACSTVPQPTTLPREPHPLRTGGFSTGVKVPGRESDHSPPSSAAIKKVAAIPLNRVALN
jgi:hypothetical protein